MQALRGALEEQPPEGIWPPQEIQQQDIMAGFQVSGYKGAKKK